MHFYDQIIHWYMENINYFTITLLMMIESTVIPLPSELVIPPAVYKALDSGQMHIAGIILCGTFGALLGASINYFVSRYVGRIIVYRFVRPSEADEVRDRLLAGFRTVDPCLTTYYIPRAEAAKRGYAEYLQSMWTVYAVK